MLVYQLKRHYKDAKEKHKAACNKVDPPEQTTEIKSAILDALPETLSRGLLEAAEEEASREQRKKTRSSISTEHQKQTSLPLENIVSGVAEAAVVAVVTRDKELTAAQEEVIKLREELAAIRSKLNSKTAQLASETRRLSNAAEQFDFNNNEPFKSKSQRYDAITECRQQMLKSCGRRRGNGGIDSPSMAKCAEILKQLNTDFMAMKADEDSITEIMPDSAKESLTLTRSIEKNVGGMIKYASKNSNSNEQRENLYVLLTTLTVASNSSKITP